MTAVGGRVLVVWCPAGPEPEAGGLEQMIAAMEEFCPRVTALDPETCAIPARGPARHFGGEEAMAEKILEAMARRGVTRGASCRVGVADGRFAAELAARRGQPVTIVPAGDTPGFLAPFPVSVLDDPLLADLLPRLGLRTLGDFAALPAAEAESRFGPAGTLAHRLARGLDPRPLVPRAPAEDLSAAREFDPPEQQAEPVVFAAKALAEQMHSVLAARGLACVRVRVHVVFADGGETTRLWRHDGLLSALAVAERVRWQLAGAGIRASKSVQNECHVADAHVGGITLLRLEPDQLVRATGRQLGLWGDSVVSDRVARAAMRVQAMLGHGAVTRPVLSGGRGPSERVMLLPFGDAGEPALSPDGPWPGRLPPPAPATVYPSPVPARVGDGAGRPVTVSGRGAVSASPALLAVGGGPSLAVTGWAGPWPVTERWWDPSRASRKARFQLVTEDGMGWLAAVRDGRWLIDAAYGLAVPQTASPSAGWYLPAGASAWRNVSATASEDLSACIPGGDPPTASKISSFVSASAEVMSSRSSS
jgi:protein ImuB